MGTPERSAAQLLLWCARRAVDADSAASGGVPEMDDGAWSHFLRECLRHSCLPIAWRALEPRSGVPPAVRDDLRTAFEANAVRNLRLAGELVTATRQLEAAGVPAASWKGPLLAQRAYGDIGLRQFFDLDLLVRRGDLGRAVEALGALGFAPERAMTDRQRSMYVDHMGELELVRASDGLWLELHTAIVPTYFAPGRTTDVLWDRVRPARLVRAEVGALDPVDEFEALCVHGSKHRWERLAWIVDIAMMARLLDAAAWQRLFDGAARHGSRRMVETAILLAVDVCAADVPVAVVRTARQDTGARRLARLARGALFDPRPGRLFELKFHARMWERPADRVRYLVNVALTPSVADWESVPLPRPLFPLYLLIRPMRMSAQHAGRLAARARGAARDLDVDCRR